MRVLVTGGLGLIGRSVVSELLLAGHTVRLFDTRQSGPIRKLVHSVNGTARVLVRSAIARLGRARDDHPLEVVRGDLCNVADVGEAVRDMDAVIHLGALIPPAADRNPRYAAYVNEGGTDNLIRALEHYAPDALLVYASSIAVYGDRRKAPLIRSSDRPNPGRQDHYARQKLAAESTVRGSKVAWTILRLSYIVSPEKLQMDPLMFHMPLETSIEVCTVRDTARAMVAALTTPDVVGRVLNIAGGPRCRTNYRDYLGAMTRLFGLGSEFLPPSAFSTTDFHCGYMDTAESEHLLHYQHDTLADYYGSVARVVRVKRRLLRALPPVRAFLRRLLLRRSPYGRLSA